MDSWQPSTLSWSFSRKTHFDSCRRHYFFHRFWGQDPKAKWRLFEMRNLTTLTMLRGELPISGTLSHKYWSQAILEPLYKESVSKIEIDGAFFESTEIAYLEFYGKEVFSNIVV